jgi:hypothetical protein
MAVELFCAPISFQCYLGKNTPKEIDAFYYLGISFPNNHNCRKYLVFSWFCLLAKGVAEGHALFGLIK